jgi:hypothetical protein
MNTDEPKLKRKTEIKIGKDFWVIENLIQMICDLKFFKTYESDVLFCSSHRIEQNDENKIKNRNHMTEINHFNFFTYFSGDVAMTNQLK